MVSLTTPSNARYLSSPVVSSLGLGTNLKIRTRVALVVVRNYTFWGFKDLKKTRTTIGFLCKGSLERESESVLEMEILKFMKISKNPNDFPTKKELLDAGRDDLVNAIIKKGGWLSLGWDSSDSDDENENEWNRKEFDEFRDLHTRFDPSLTSSSSSHQGASPSGRPLETVVEEDAGIDGILHRLEKHRSFSFGVSVQENGHTNYSSNSENGGQISTDVATEIYHLEKSNSGEKEDLKDAEFQEINSNYIKSRLQQMQVELSSSLRLLRSESDTRNPDGYKNLSCELQQLSDAWEFQETEIMNSKDRLRSLRAKLAVLQGKMSLSLSDARKLVEEKQRRIDSAHTTVQLLRSTCIVWPNSGAEVLLVGSFDGWTTQRKMERSSSGIFSLSLKLYPGRYEIKFIVDGVWRVDPLRPIVNNNGYENNVLIIHDYDQ